MKRSIRVMKVQEMVKGDEIIAFYTTCGWVNRAPVLRLRPDTTVKVLMRG